jgi:transposase
MRMGWFRPVHAKSVGSREVRALLVARKQLLSKLMDLEASMRGILWGFGLKMGVVRACENFPPARQCWSRSRARCWRRGLRFWREFEQLHREMLRIARDDDICRRLTSTPGVGPLVAITFKSAIDDPDRIAKSRTVGAPFGTGTQGIPIRGEGC